MKILILLIIVFMVGCNFGMYPDKTGAIQEALNNADNTSTSDCFWYCKHVALYNDGLTDRVLSDEECLTICIK